MHGLGPGREVSGGESDESSESSRSLLRRCYEAEAKGQNKGKDKGKATGKPKGGKPKAGKPDP